MTNKLYKLAENFSNQLSKYSQENPAETVGPQLQNIYAELETIVRNFISRNPIEIKITKRPHVSTATENKNAQIAAGLVITKDDFNEYIKQLNNEIQKLKEKYPNIDMFAFYDKRSTFKADL